MISIDGVDLTLLDDKGRTLVSQLCISLNFNTEKTLEFLLKQKNIGLDIADTEEFLAIHHLVNHNLDSLTDQKIFQNNFAN
jgi:hypothetical protein